MPDLNTPELMCHETLKLNGRMWQDTPELCQGAIKLNSQETLKLNGRICSRSRGTKIKQKDVSRGTKTKQKDVSRTKQKDASRDSRTDVSRDTEGCGRGDC